MTPPPRDFADYSWSDPNGRILQSREDAKFIYRSVTKESYEIFHDLKSRGKLSILIEKGLVETEETSLEVQGYYKVLKHKRLPFVSMPNEWTMLMLRDAGLVICNLELALDKLGYGLHDGHPWNVSFSGATPVFLDWGSITRKENISFTSWLSEYRKHIYLPLWLYQKGLRTFAYESLWERFGGAAKHLLAHRYLKNFPLAFYARTKNPTQENSRAILQNVLQLTQRINIEEASGFWSSYDQGSYPYKDAAFQEFLDSLPGSSTIMDLGCNKGAYSIRCSQAGHQVVALDYDAVAINGMYLNARQNHYNITPLRVDLMRPTPGYGPDLSFPDIFERLRSDYVIAFAISHHLAKNNLFQFEVLARVLNLYAKKGTLVEYIDLADHHLKSWQSRGWQAPSWYNEQGFVDAFVNVFGQPKKVWRTAPEDHIVRKIFYFSKEGA